MDPIWRDAKPLVEQNGTPLHEQLREIIRAKVERELLVPGDLLPPELELAKAYGVSRTTIRRALADLTQQGLLHRTAGKGTYVQEPRTGVARAVALVCPFVPWYLTNLVEGVEAAVRAAGFELIIRNSRFDADVEAEQLEELRRMDVAGVLLWPTIPEFQFTPSKAVQNLLAGSHPAVIIDQWCAEAASVTSANFGGTYLAAEHLLRSGRTHLGFVTPNEQMPYTVDQRWAGMREAVRNFRLPCDERMCFGHWPNRTLFEQWLDELRIDALICVNDIVAMKVVEALSELGRSVPDDIAVIGYGDIPPAHTSRPTLTTVRRDLQAMGHSAGRLLVDRMHRPHRAPQHIELPVHLVIRASSDAEAQEDPAASTLTPELDETYQL